MPRSQHKIAIWHLYSCQSRVYLHIMNVYVSHRQRKKNGENYEKHPAPPALVCFTCLIRISFYFCLLFRSILCSIPTPLRWQKYKAAFECVFGIQPTTHVDLREIISKVLRIKWVNFECTQFVRSIVETPPLSVASMSIVRATISRIPLYRSHPETFSPNIFVLFRCEFRVCLVRGWKEGLSIRFSGTEMFTSLSKHAIRIPGSVRDSLGCVRIHCAVCESVSFMGIIRDACTWLYRRILYCY